MISQLSSFRYIEVDEEALETYLKPLELVNATFMEEKDHKEKKSLSFIYLKSEKLTMENGGPKGWGHMISISEKKDDFDLGYIPPIKREARVRANNITRSTHELFLSVVYIHDN